MLAGASELAALGSSIGSRVDEGQGWTHMALGHARQGRFEQALNYTEQVGALSAAIGHANEEHGHQLVRIELYLAVGALEEAEHWADRLYTQRETIMPVLIHPYLARAALAKVANGKLQEGRAILEEVLSSLPADTATSYVIINIAIAFAHLHLAQGKPEGLFTGFEEQIQTYREAGFESLLADEHWLRGWAALALGQYDAARESLLKAKEAAEAHEERAILWKILATMSKLETACSDIVAANKFRDQARAMIDDIAEHAGKMRDVFLRQSEVIQLLCEN
jgi:tetratricopeptide (TPR) repeat protein